MEVNALLKTLPSRLAEVKAKTATVQAKALVIQFAATLAEIEAKTIGGTLRYVEVEALVDRTADTLQEKSVRIMATYKAM